jgi:hypothetical protein
MNKTDKLEKFVVENRSEFDSLDAPKDLFNRIELELDRKEKGRKIFSMRNWMKIAAILLLPMLFGIGYFVFRNVDNSQTQIALNIKNKNVDQNMLNLIETESFYKNKIDSQCNKLESMASNNPEIIAEVSEMMKDLDVNYQELSKDLNENLNKEVVINAMINQQRLQLQTINDMIDQISSTN